MTRNRVFSVNLQRRDHNAQHMAPNHARDVDALVQQIAGITLDRADLVLRLRQQLLLGGLRAAEAPRIPRKASSVIYESHLRLA